MQKLNRLFSLALIGLLTIIARSIHYFLLMLFSSAAYSFTVTPSVSALNFPPTEVGETSTLSLTYTYSPDSDTEIFKFGFPDGLPLISGEKTVFYFSDINCVDTSIIGTGPTSAVCFLKVSFSPLQVNEYAESFTYLSANPQLIPLSGIGVGNSAGGKTEPPVTREEEVTQILAPFTGNNLNSVATSKAIAAACVSGQAGSDLQRDCNALVQAAGDKLSGTVSAINQITPESATKSTRATQQGATSQSRNISARMTALRSGASGVSLQGLSLNLQGKHLPVGSIAHSYLSSGGGASADSAALLNAKLGFFVSGEVAVGDRDASSLESGLDFKTQGLTAGVDYRFSEQFFLGAAVGYIDTQTNFDNTASELKAKGYSVSLFGSYYHPSEFFIDASFTAGKNNFDQLRVLDYQLGNTLAVNQQFNADYQGNYYSVLLGAGRDYYSGPWTFGPRANLQYTKISADQIVEASTSASALGSGWATQIDSTQQESLILQLGAKASYAKSTQWGVLIPFAQVDLLHEFKQDAQLITARFLQDPSAAKLNVKTDKPDRNYVRVSLGSSIQFKQGVSGFVNYSTELAKRAWEGHNFSIGVRAEF